MAIGIGSDGYRRRQKEVTYGVALNNSMTDLPITAEGSLFKFERMNIDNNANIFSRTHRTPSKGRENITAPGESDVYPSILGETLDFLAGVNSSTLVVTDVFKHIFLAPSLADSGLAGQTNQPGSFTAQEALGSELADQFKGCRTTQLTIRSNNEGNVSMTEEAIGIFDTTDVARISTFSVPAEIPYNFGNVVFSLDAETQSSIILCLSEFELVINMNLDIERFCLGKKTIDNPPYLGRPEVTATLTLRDGEQRFVDFARDHENISLTITLTSEINIPTTTTKFSTIIELPGGRIDPTIEVPTSADRIQDMAVPIDFKYGGTTTNSGSDNIMFEIAHTDGTTSY